MPSAVEASRLGAEVPVSSRELQMISMLVIARPELLPHVHWIESMPSRRS